MILRSRKAEGLSLEMSVEPNSSVEFRCPQCEKLYLSSFTAQHAFFECTDCHAQFKVEKEAEAKKAVTRAFALPQISKPVVQGVACPNCGNLNPKGLSECPKCQVVIAKMDGLTPEVKKEGGRPSLLRAWQELVKDYSNLQKHMAFVDQCDDLQALPFALRKYKELKEAQPQDETAQKMFQTAFLRSLKKQPQVQKLQLWLERVNWSRVLRLAPVVLGALFVLVGLISRGQRNLVGFGAAILFLYFGFQYVTKGKISLTDLWK